MAAAVEAASRVYYPTSQQNSGSERTSSDGSNGDGIPDLTIVERIQPLSFVASYPSSRPYNKPFSYSVCQLDAAIHSPGIINVTYAVYVISQENLDNFKSRRTREIRLNPTDTLTTESEVLAAVKSNRFFIMITSLGGTCLSVVQNFVSEGEEARIKGIVVTNVTSSDKIARGEERSVLIQDQKIKKIFKSKPTNCVPIDIKTYHTTDVMHAACLQVLANKRMTSAQRAVEESRLKKNETECIELARKQEAVDIMVRCSRIPGNGNTTMTQGQAADVYDAQQQCLIQ